MNSRNRLLIATIPDILLVSDVQGNIKPFTEYSSQKNVSYECIMTRSEIITLLKNAVLEVAAGTDDLTREFQIEENERCFYFEARFRKSEINEVLIMIRDMTDRIELEHKLKDLVERDALTKIYNRRHFEEIMSYYNGKEMNGLAIVSIDINGLKFVNDTIGHLKGDQFIVQAAHIMKSVFGEKYHLSRIGGDEFGVLLTDVSEEQVEQMLTVLDTMINCEDSPDKMEGLTLAFGYAYHKKGIVDMELLFQVADNHMYQNKVLKKESNRNNFVQTFMKALEAKDFVSKDHVLRLENLAVMIGEDLSSNRNTMDKVILLTKFHDIGKIGIPDDILKKPAALTDAEWLVMKTHSAIGERIAKEATEIKEVAPLILKHHERWDGKGYPLGLLGTDIPIECRILAVADTFDAITNDRPYRKAMTVDEAIEEIVRCSGTQFDPYLVTIFGRIMKSEKYRLMKY